MIKQIFSSLSRKRLSGIEFFKANAGEVQERQLRELLKSAGGTAFGRQHDFKSISSFQVFKERVPVQDYEGLLPSVIRLRQGEENLLWPGKIKWFAKSSGTTSSKSKFIPISPEALNRCHFQGGRDVLVIYNQLVPGNRIFSGKTLTLGGSHEINSFSKGSIYGDLSAILIQNIPTWANLIRTPPKEIALLSDWEKKLPLITGATIKQNVTAMAGVPSWLMVLLKNVLAETGKRNLNEVWPNLELFIHGGVSFVPYRDQYLDMIPSPGMNYMETYNASEGFFAIQDDFSSKGMLLMLDYGVFFEFMPLRELGKQYPTTYSIEETLPDTNYALVISTNGGLWRYIIGDTVKVVSRKPYKIIISGRTKHYINAFGEEVIIENAEKALQAACNATGAEIRDYTAAPVFMDANAKGAHQWLIEFSKPPVNFHQFVQVLDITLKEANSDYEAKRYKDFTMSIPQVTIARDNLFFDWMKKRNKLGGQNKVPRLANDREYIDSLLELNHQ